MKLHLGCGQRYLEGYVNIDFPPSEHSVQEKTIADIHADILTLRYPAESIKEVRLHHVFEHFPRPIACALVASWRSWLAPKGTIHIEVPDFHKTAQVLLNPFASLARKAVAERHLFGSHEAHWAVHCEGYTQELLKALLKSYGFQAFKIHKNAWLGTYNFEMLAVKAAAEMNVDTSEKATRHFLRNFLVDDSEEKLLDVWLEMYRQQILKSWATDA